MTMESPSEVAAIAPFPSFRRALGSAVFRHPLPHRTKRPIQIFRLGTAGLGKIRASSALAADLLCDEVYQIAGLNPSKQIITDSRGQSDLAVAGSADDHHRAAQAVLQTVHRIAQCLRLDIVEPRGEHLDAVDIDGLAKQFVAAGGWRFST